MSTRVLARKHRPRHFEAMVGQPHVVQALSNALSQRRLHHAWLFTGTRGVGKTTVARILAKALNCTGADGDGGITAHPCGTCPACRQIDEGRFVDYVELDAASNRGVDEMTQLLEQSVYKPVAGRFKVYLIDEVHMLSGHAFNSMLKTLEEPPEYLKFILATTDPQKVPPTVLSRCLQFNLRPMDPRTIAEHLANVLAAEAVDAEPPALRLLARAARGSMRDALSLADQAIATGGGRVGIDAVRQMLGAVDRRHAVRIVEAVAAFDGRAVVAAVDGLRAHGLPAAGTLEEVVALLQDIAVRQALGDEGSAAEASDAAAADDDGHVARLARVVAADEAQVLYAILLAGRPELALAHDEYGGLTMLLLRMLAFRPASEPRDVAVPSPAVAAMPVPKAPRSATSAPVAAPVIVAAPAPHRAPASTSAESPCDRWAGWVERMIGDARISAMARELAMQAGCVRIDDAEGATTVTLAVEKESLRATALVDRLQAALAALLDRPVRFVIEGGAAADSVADRRAAEQRRRQAEAERTIHDDPLVKALLAQYKTARIVPGSVKPI